MSKHFPGRGEENHESAQSGDLVTRPIFREDVTTRSACAVCGAICWLSSELYSGKFESEGISSCNSLRNIEILREKGRVNKKWTSRRVCWSPQIWLLSKVTVPLHFSIFLQTTRQSTTGQDSNTASLPNLPLDIEFTPFQRVMNLAKQRR
jgi:hypothetical protein